MRAQMLKLNRSVDLSFSVRRDQVPYVNNRWHFHEEVELVHFRAGEGVQFIGDSVKRFKAGDVVLVGANLPHYWRFDDEYFDETTMNSADISVSHFMENFWGERFLELPENVKLKSLLHNAKRGIVLKGKTREYVAGLLDQLIDASGAQRIVLLMAALTEMATCNDIELLSSIGFNAEGVDIDEDRISAVIDFTKNNFQRKIELKEVAEVANLSQNSFCRYFKSKTGKTYSQYIMELRVGRACKLLIENRLCLKQLCYESGFNNFTSFHKYFKLIMGKSPLNYQKQFVGGGCSV